MLRASSMSSGSFCPSVSGKRVARQPEDFGEVKKQGGDPTNPCHQGTDAHSLVPHC